MRTTRWHVKVLLGTFLGCTLGLGLGFITTSFPDIRLKQSQFMAQDLWMAVAVMADEYERDSGREHPFSSRKGPSLIDRDLLSSLEKHIKLPARFVDQNGNAVDGWGRPFMIQFAVRDKKIVCGNLFGRRNSFFPIPDPSRPALKIDAPFIIWSTGGGHPDIKAWHASMSQMK